MTTLATNGHQIGDRYTLLGKLGEGGESEVWRARDHQQGGEVALKVLRPEIAAQPGSWEALERQHEISRRLESPLILRVESPVRDGDVVALPMELAPGGDLRRLCGVSYLEIVPVLIEVAQALAHAHARGIVHRDLKPGNVLFDARGHVRLTDFDPAPSALSPFTASPQQLSGEPATAADDIYGLGALAYELLSGHPPFYPRFERRRVLEEPVPQLKPAHLAPGRLVSLVMSMLAKHPRQRPASMQDVLDTLDMALNDTLTFTYDDRPAALATPPNMVPQAPKAEAAPPVSPRPTAPPPRPPLITPAPQAAPLAAARRPAPPLQTASDFWESGSAPPHPAPTAAQPAPAPSHPAPTAAQPAPAPSPQAAEHPARQPAPAMRAASAATPIRAERAHETDLRALWGDIRVERVPSLMKLEPVRRPRWPWVLAAGIAAAAIAAFLVRHNAVDGHTWVKPSVDQLRALTPPAIERAVRSAVEAPLHAMQNGSPATHTADAASTEPEPAGSAHETGPPNDETSRPTTDQPQSTAAVRRHDQPHAHAAPSVASTQSAQSGQSAQTAPPSAATGSTASSGTSPQRAVGAAPGAHSAAPRATPVPAAQRGRTSPGVEPLLTDARAAESARDFSRAAQDYSQALALDPRNAAARAGLDRANAAFGAGEYSQAVGSGFAALGAGRLEEARQNFEHARSIDPRGSEAALGLREVAAALKTRDAATARYRERSDLESHLQALVDDPKQLDSAAVRAQAASLLREAETMPSSGAVMRSLASRLALLMPAYNKPVHLALVSDNLTEIEIPDIGSFGTFSRREINLKPGKYTVIGTRAGYREVRRDVTVAPGQSLQTVSVRCEVPI